LKSQFPTLLFFYTATGPATDFAPDSGDEDFMVGPKFDLYAGAG
jgi:hypothetical protein